MLDDISLHDKYESNIPPETLKRFRAKVNDISELNIEQELLDNYNDAQDILTNLDPLVTPANQQAQAMNTINGILKDIIKMRTDLYNAERIKKIEASIIYTLKQFPELHEAFLTEYERALSR